MDRIENSYKTISIYNMVLAKLHLALENNAANMKDVQADFNKVKNAVKEAQRSALLQLDEARAMGTR